MEPLRPILVLPLDGRGPRQGQIVRALERVVDTGVLAPGARLPSSRELARSLGCARNLVLHAYEQLTSEGLLVGRRGAGTFVGPPHGRATPVDSWTPSPGRAGSRPPGVPPSARRLARIAHTARSVIRRPSGVDIDFMFGLCAPDARAVRGLRAALGAALKAKGFGYPEIAGDGRLRREIAERLRASRGLAVSADQILMTEGAQQALDVCARLLLAPGEAAVVEDPGYEGARAAFEAAGASLIHAPVDEHGVIVEKLPRAPARVRLVYVTPSHQFPTGVPLSAARRQSLLAWAAGRRAFVFEDDYDCEFQYGGRRIVALAALAPERVIYCGTFAKSLFPSIRLGYVALPPALVPAAIACKWIADRGSPTLLQRAVARLMETGEYDRHIRRMQRRYRERRQTIVRTLRRELGDEVDVAADGAGLHVVAWFPRLPASATDRLVEVCRTRRVGVYSVARHAHGRLRRAGLILGYGLLDLPRIEPGVLRLVSAYRALVG